MRQIGDPVPNAFPFVEPSGAARIAIVGQSPGKDEDHQGVPFVGESGRLLDGALGQAGIPRNQCFVGNVCQHRPNEENDFNQLDWGGQWVQEGIEQLRADLEKFKPTIVLCLGNEALHLFRNGNVETSKVWKLGRQEFDWPDRVGNWRGSLFESGWLKRPCRACRDRFELSPEDRAKECPMCGATDWEGELGVKCLSTFHPAAVTRDYGLQGYYRVVQGVGDMERLRIESKDQSLVLPRCKIGVVGRDHTLVEGLLMLSLFLEEGKPVSFDLEGGCGNVTSLAFSRKPESALVFPLAHCDGTSVWTEEDELTIWEAVKGLLESPKVEKIAQNGARYDFFVLAWTYGIAVQNYRHDTELSWWEVAPELSKSLATQTSLLTKEPFYKPDKEEGELVFESDDEFWNYNGLDAARTFDVWQKELAMMGPGQRAHYDWNTRFLPRVLYMELRGMKVDQARVKETKDKAGQEQSVLQAQIDQEQARQAGVTGDGLRELNEVLDKGGEKEFARLVLKRLGGKNPRVKKEVVEERWQPMNWEVPRRKDGSQKGDGKWKKAGKITLHPEDEAEGYVDSAWPMDPEPPKGFTIWLKPVPKTVSKLVPFEPDNLASVEEHVLESHRAEWRVVKRLWKELKHGPKRILQGVETAVSRTLCREEDSSGEKAPRVDSFARNDPLGPPGMEQAATGICDSVSDKKEKELKHERHSQGLQEAATTSDRTSQEVGKQDGSGARGAGACAGNNEVREEVSAGMESPCLRPERTALASALGLSVNTGSNAQEGATQRFLFETCKLPRIFVHVKSGRLSKEAETDQKKRLAGQKVAVPSGKKVTTDQNALDKLYAGTQDVRALWVLQQRRLRKAVSDLESEIDSDGRIRCAISLVKDTGRMAASKAATGTGANLMAWNKDLRRVVVADEGCDFYRFDLAGADSWTVAAELAALGDTTMLDDLRAGLKPAKILCLYYAFGNCVNEWSRDRICDEIKKLALASWVYPGAKSSCHGTAYGAGWQMIRDITLKYSLADLPLELSNAVPIVLAKTEVEKFQGSFLLRYKIKKWHEAEGRVMMDLGLIFTSPGHIRRFYGRKAEWDSRLGRKVPCHETLKSWLADKPQFYTTYALKLALERLWEDKENRRADGSLRVEPLLCVHDSLDTQAKEEDRSFAAKKLREWFQNEIVVAGVKLVIPAEGVRGKDWGQEGGTTI